MQNGSTPVSESQKAMLQEITRQSLDDFLKIADAARNSVRQIDKISVYMAEQKMEVPPEYHHLRRLSECTLLLGLVWLDMTAGCRVYLRAEGTYENPYAAKQLIVTINEGFKQIYGYQWYDEKGNLRSRERNQSFWVKDIGAIVKNELPAFNDKYQQISLELESYNDQDLRDLKDPRDLFVHYDKTASRVYDEMIRQDMHKTFTKLLPFMNIIAGMIRFIRELAQAYSALIAKRKDDTASFHLQKLEALKAQHAAQPELVKILEDMQCLIRNNYL